MQVSPCWHVHLHCSSCACCKVSVVLVSGVEWMEASAPQHDAHAVALLAVSVHLLLVGSCWVFLLAVHGPWYTWNEPRLGFAVGAQHRLSGLSCCHMQRCSFMPPAWRDCCVACPGCRRLHACVAEMQHRPVVVTIISAATRLFVTTAAKKCYTSSRRSQLSQQAYCTKLQHLTHAHGALLLGHPATHQCCSTI